jgi:hypothetical protein
MLLRRGLQDAASFAGFEATTDFRLTLMRRKPWDEEELNYVCSPSGATDLCRPSGARQSRACPSVPRLTPHRR